MKLDRLSPPAGFRICVRLALLALALQIGISGGAPARADDDDAAEAALERGEVAPQAALFDRLAADFGGQVLKLDLEREDGDRAWIYEVKLLLSDGQVIRVEYDAVTLEILEVAGRRAEASDADADDGAPASAGQGAQGAQGAAGNADSSGRGRSPAGAAD